MATTATRLGALGMLTALVVGACSGGFGGAASPSAAPATAPASAAAPSAPASAAAPSEAAAPVKLTYFVDDNNVTQARLQGLIDAYTALHPNVTIEIETHPGGSDGDNLVKTRLATGDMPDIFYYNSGSLLQALNPSDTLVDLSRRAVHREPPGDLPADGLGERRRSTASRPRARSAAASSTTRRSTATSGSRSPRPGPSSRPTTRRSRRTARPRPVCATFGDTWTSQLFVLADYYNVAEGRSGLRRRSTRPTRPTTPTRPAAQAGFEHLKEAFDKGWYQKDFGADKFDNGPEAAGQRQVRPLSDAHLRRRDDGRRTSRTQIDDIGFFGQPGDDAATNGATIWMPAATYIPKTTTGAQLDAAKEFVDFIGSVEGTEAMSAGVAPSGPYVIKGSTLPDNVPAAIKDIQPYIDGGNNLAGARVPVSGEGSVARADHGRRRGPGSPTAEEAAKQYDQDVAKQAKQLGLPGW